MDATGEEFRNRPRGPSVEDGRDRLLRLGAAALTDPELLAVLFGSGADVSAVAEGLLAAGGGLKTLLSEDPHELCARRGLGRTRAAQVLAALELARRALTSPEQRPRLRTPSEVHAYLAPRLGGLRREVFHVLSFNSRNVLLHDGRVAEGTADSCPVDPREVFRAALAARATAVVLAHNHPSGDPDPSESDLALTRQLMEGARVLGIRVLDHVIVGDGRYASLLARGTLGACGRSGTLS